MFTSPASSDAGSAALNWLRRGTAYVLLGARCLPPSISVHCHHKPEGRYYQSYLTYKEPEKCSDKQQNWVRKPGFLNIKHKQSHWAVLRPPITDYDQGNFSLLDNSAVTSPCIVTFVSSSLPLLFYFIHESELWEALPHHVPSLKGNCHPPT